MTAASLRGRTALVTGGSRGIGAAISRALAEGGAAVAINYRERAEDAGNLAALLRDKGAHVMAIAADVSQHDAVHNMVEAVKSELGRGLVGVLATLSAAGSTLLMLHFLRRLAATGASAVEKVAPAGLTSSWLVIAFAAVAVRTFDG